MFEPVARLITEILTPARNQKILNLGSGTHEYYQVIQPWIGAMLHQLREHNTVINLDAKFDKGVDLVADAAVTRLPSESIDIILCCSLLEHTPDPAAVIRECRRIIQPTGLLIAECPWHYPLHPDPIDNGLRLGQHADWADTLEGFSLLTWDLIEDLHGRGDCTLITATPNPLHITDSRLPLLARIKDWYQRESNFPS